MTEELHNYYLNKGEPNKSCPLALWGIILDQDKEVAGNAEVRNALLLL